MDQRIHLHSLDPRVNRLNITEDQVGNTEDSTGPLEHLETYEVFHQAKTGARHVHVGSIHAATPGLAIAFAKEQFGRRSQTVNMWVVRTEDIITLSPEDADIFTTASEKDFREASGYKVMQKLNAFKKARAKSSEDKS